MPIVVEALGGWGPAAQVFFKKLARALALRNGRTESVESAMLYQSVAVKLQRFNARSIIAGCTALDVDATAPATFSSFEAALVASTSAESAADVVFE